MSEEPGPDNPTNEITAAEIEELLATIKTAAVQADLNDRQKALLDAIIKMFKEVEAAELPLPEPADRIPFEDSFLPGRAKVVMDYANPQSDSESSTTLYSQVAQYITRTQHP